MNRRQNVLGVSSGRPKSYLPVFRAAAPLSPPAIPALQAGNLVVSHHLPPQPCLIGGGTHQVNHAAVLVPRGKRILHGVPAPQQLEIRHANCRRPNANPRPTGRGLRIGEFRQAYLPGLFKTNGSHITGR